MNDCNLISHRVDKIKNVFAIKNILASIIDFDNSNEVSNITISDIRDLIFKNSLDFSRVIEILDGKLLYIKSGSTGHTFRGVQDSDNKLSYAVKIVAYPKKVHYGDLYNSLRPENVEILMLKILSYFVINKETPHIVLPITTFNTDVKPFLSLCKNNIVTNDKYKQFVNRYKNGEYYNNVSILVSEWANGGDLLDYLKKNYKYMDIKEWTILFFQIISVLAIIQSKYPAFRHNDMKANNILLNNLRIPNNHKKYKYNINGTTYVVPHIGYQIKIWDFDFACIDKIIINSKVESKWAMEINITSKQNRYYDLHYFFNTLIKKGFLSELITEPNVPNEVIEFIDRVLPKKYRVGEYTTPSGRFLGNNEFILPADILQRDVLFKSMREPV